MTIDGKEKVARYEKKRKRQRREKNEMNCHDLIISSDSKLNVLRVVTAGYGHVETSIVTSTCWWTTFLIPCTIAILCATERILLAESSLCLYRTSDSTTNWKEWT